MKQEATASPVPIRNKAWLLTPAAKQRNSISPTARRPEATGTTEYTQIGRHRLAIESPTPGASISGEQAEISMDDRQRSSDEGRGPEAVPSDNVREGHKPAEPLSFQSETRKLQRGRYSSAPQEEANSSSNSPKATDQERSGSISPQLGDSRQQVPESPVSGLQLGKPRPHKHFPAASELSKRQWQYKLPIEVRDTPPEQSKSLQKDASQGSPLWMVPKLIHRAAKPNSTLGTPFQI